MKWECKTLRSMGNTNSYVGVEFDIDAFHMVIEKNRQLQKQHEQKLSKDTFSHFLEDLVQTCPKIIEA